MFFQSLNKSLAFRSSSVYKILQKSDQSYKYLSIKPEMGISLLTMTGVAHSSMLWNCLLSIASTWSEIPPLILVDDGSGAARILKKKISWWQSEILVRDKDHYINYHQNLKRYSLCEYTKNDPFGLKLAAILAEAEQNTVFWCDADVLFFKDFSEEINSHKANLCETLIWTTEDLNSEGYDPNIINLLPTSHRLSKPINTGMVLIKGNIYDQFNLLPLIDAAKLTRNGLTEQTILAKATLEAGVVKWGLDTIQITGTDSTEWKPSFLTSGAKARHYIKPTRQSFWRDAFFLRLQRNRIF